MPSSPLPLDEELPAAALLVLPKGRLLAPAQRRLEAGGLEPPRFGGRNLHARVAGGRAFLARGRDIPLYIRSGAAELGVLGHDVWLEDGEGLVELADLGFGRCRLVFAAPAGVDVERPGLRVATRYPRLTQRYLAQRSLTARVVALAGAVEAAVGAGLADAVVDVAETGRTLAAHGLVVQDTVAESTARLVARADQALGERAQELARRLAAGGGDRG